MIYSAVDAAAPIEQGDIFTSIPRCDIELSQFLKSTDAEGTEPRDWATISPAPGEALTALVGFRSVLGVVVSPDCDAIRGESISFSEIVPLTAINKDFPNQKTPDKWVQLYTRQLKLSNRWFYFPENTAIGFGEKKATDFREFIRLPRADMDRMKAKHRIARLTPLAKEYFRNRLGNYFGAYASDEWLPFNKAEFTAYNAIYGGTIKPFDGQI